MPGKYACSGLSSCKHPLLNNSSGMADAIGLGIGMASFVLQVASGIKKLRSTINYNKTQAPQDLASLCTYLELLLEILKTMQTSQASSLASSILTECHRTYEGLDAQLNKVLERFPPKSVPGRQHLRSKIRNTLSDNRAIIEAIQTEVFRLTQFLIL